MTLGEMIMSRYKTIVVENNLDEIDTLGLLLEKYTQGTHYDLGTHTFTVPEKLIDELKQEKKHDKDNSNRQ